MDGQDRDESYSDLLSPQRVLDLTPDPNLDVKSNYHDEWDFFNRGGELLKLGREIREMILEAAKNELSGARDFRLNRLVDLLTALTYLRDKQLEEAVRREMSGLGLPLPSRKGRPPGHQDDVVYYRYVEGVEKIIGEKGIFDLKAELRAKFPTRWQTELRKILKRNWDQEDIDRFTTTGNPRSFAKYRAAAVFEVQHSTIDRAYRRYRISHP